MTDNVRDLTQTIYEVAKRTSAGSQLVTQAVVLSINPDGSLNVDDGKGGCLRRVPKQNARVGDTVRIGTEPNIGQTTNLPQQIISISPPTGSCPMEPRLKPKNLSITSAIVFGRIYTTALAWPDALVYTPVGGSYPYYGTYHDAAFTVTAAQDSSIPKFVCGRSYLIFDASALPDGAVVISATLRATPSSVRSDDDIDVAIVRGTFLGFPLADVYFDDLDETVVYVTSRILDWTVGVPKDVAMLPPIVDVDKMVRLVMVTEDDISASAPPTDSINALALNGGLGTSTLTLQYAVFPPS